jgi:urease accessory protein UreF
MLPKLRHLRTAGPPSAYLRLLLENSFTKGTCIAEVIGATRLISLGQNDAQRVLSAVADTIPEAALRAASVADTDVGRALVGLCMASSWHEEQYSRLFRS